MNGTNKSLVGIGPSSQGARRKLARNWKAKSLNHENESGGVKSPLIAKHPNQVPKPEFRPVESIESYSFLPGQENHSPSLHIPNLLSSSASLLKAKSAPVLSSHASNFCDPDSMSNKIRAAMKRKRNACSTTNENEPPENGHSYFTPLNAKERISSCPGSFSSTLGKSMSPLSYRSSDPPKSKRKESTLTSVNYSSYNKEMSNDFKQIPPSRLRTICSANEDMHCARSLSREKELFDSMSQETCRIDKGLDFDNLTQGTALNHKPLKFFMKQNDISLQSHIEHISLCSDDSENPFTFDKRPVLLQNDSNDKLAAIEHCSIRTKECFKVEKLCKALSVLPHLNDDPASREMPDSSSTTSLEIDELGESQCFICGTNLKNLSILEAQVHINRCLDSDLPVPEVSERQPHSYSTDTNCHNDFIDYASTEKEQKKLLSSQECFGSKNSKSVLLKRNSNKYSKKERVNLTSSTQEGKRFSTLEGKNHQNKADTTLKLPELSSSLKTTGSTSDFVANISGNSSKSLENSFEAVAMSIDSNSGQNDEGLTKVSFRNTTEEKVNSESSSKNLVQNGQNSLKKRLKKCESFAGQAPKSVNQDELLLAKALSISLVDTACTLNTSSSQEISEKANMNIVQKEKSMVKNLVQIDKEISDLQLKKTAALSKLLAYRQKAGQTASIKNEKIDNSARNEICTISKDPHYVQNMLDSLFGSESTKRKMKKYPSKIVSLESDSNSGPTLWELTGSCNLTMSENHFYTDTFQSFCCINKSDECNTAANLDLDIERKNEEITEFDELSKDSELSDEEKSSKNVQILESEERKLGSDNKKEQKCTQEIISRGCAKWQSLASPDVKSTMIDLDGNIEFVWNASHEDVELALEQVRNKLLEIEKEAAALQFFSDVMEDRLQATVSLESGYTRE